jgi:hypothetical protein
VGMAQRQRAGIAVGSRVLQTLGAEENQYAGKSGATAEAQRAMGI